MRVTIIICSVVLHSTCSCFESCKSLVQVVEQPYPPLQIKTPSSTELDVRVSKQPRARRGGSLKKNVNVSRPSEHPPVRGESCCCGARGALLRMGDHRLNKRALTGELENAGGTRWT